MLLGRSTCNRATNCSLFHVVFGWLIEGQSLDGNLTLSIPEQDEDITVPVGYIKATELGVIPDLPPQALDQTLTVMAVPITAGT